MSPKAPQKLSIEYSLTRSWPWTEPHRKFQFRLKISKTRHAAQTQLQQKNCPIELLPMSAFEHTENSSKRPPLAHWRLSAFRQNLADCGRSGLGGVAGKSGHSISNGFSKWMAEALGRGKSESGLYSAEGVRFQPVRKLSIQGFDYSVT